MYIRVYNIVYKIESNVQINYYYYYVYNIYVYNLTNYKLYIILYIKNYKIKNFALKSKNHYKYAKIYTINF